MERFFAIIALALFGAAFGSFACCQVWRIRKKDKSKWSHCMHCKYRLQWYDNIPIVSWLALGGKCRKCRKPIGCAEILAELGAALIFPLSFVWWSAQDKLMAVDVAEIVKFGLFLAILVILIILFIYDAKWKELPVNLMVVTGVMAAVFWGISVGQAYAETGQYDWLNFVFSLVFLPGVYFLLYKVSHECWVGGGDWILCVPLALLLGDMWLSLMCVFASNVIGCAVMLPVALSKKKKKMVIPFGPFLISGFLLIFFLQDVILKFVSF